MRRKRLLLDSQRRANRWERWPGRGECDGGGGGSGLVVRVVVVLVIMKWCRTGESGC